MTIFTLRFSIYPYYTRNLYTMQMFQVCGGKTEFDVWIPPVLAENLTLKRERSAELTQQHEQVLHQTRL